jgi:glycosyltransferase involved in cell wall biosynthesis
MIVKDESRVIERCLASVKPLIDYWVIVDTGSSDKTIKIIQEFMKDIPGEIHERPWINFGHNRNEALQLAKGKGDYVLIIDADEVLAIDPSFTRPVLNKDFYHIITSYAGMEYARNQLINMKYDWKWVGVVHEVLVSSNAHNYATLEGVKNIVHTDGARSVDPEKYLKDARLLETALLENPSDTRTLFYLAQSYRDAGDHVKALENYEKRVQMGGWDQELFWAQFQVAILQEQLNYPEKTVVNSYYQAFYSRPSRIEPLYRLATYYRKRGNYFQGYLIANIAQSIPLSKDLLFVEKWMYEYGVPLELSICAYWIGKYEESHKLSVLLMNNENVPFNVRECAKTNMYLASTKMVGEYLGIPDKGELVAQNK